MRISFLGKGGSGKTTMAASFIRYAARRNPFVLCMDADVNVHLQAALQLNGKAKRLSEIFGQVTEYLKGERTDLGPRPMIWTTPPSLHSRFIYMSPADSFIQQFALQQENIALLTVGTYEEKDVDTGTCFHTKLHSIESVFHHLLDGENDIVVADTTAGTDNVATSLSFVYDLNIFVVEPTLKSLAVYKDFCKIAPHLEHKIFVIGNKIANLQDEEFVKKNVKENCYLGSASSSTNLKRFEQGESEGMFAFEKEQGDVFARVYDLLKQQKRDWSTYLAMLRESHTRVCQSYINRRYGTNVEEGIDPDFKYETILAKEVQEEIHLNPGIPVAVR